MGLKTFNSELPFVKPGWAGNKLNSEGSGYSPHFADIARDYDIDVAMIGVGAYEPQWFMRSAHTGPAAAYQAFKDLNAKRWIPMHYGAFDLSAEPIYYPELILRQQHPKALAYVDWMRIGERMVV